MLEFLRSHQLNIMLILSGICGMIALFVAITKGIPKKRKIALLSVELGMTFLLLFDRYAYIYRGDVTDLGFWMVRISNFLVFFLSLFILGSFNLYLNERLLSGAGLDAVPRRVRLNELLVIIGMLMLVISQFTGLYYTFDESNHYQRGPLFALCYVFPLMLLISFLTLIVQYGGRLKKIIRIPMMVFVGMSLAASIVQFFVYGLSVTNIVTAFVFIILYVFDLIELNDVVDQANRIRIDDLKVGQKNLWRLFQQTVSTLVNAIDAKNEYMRGHSRRVAEYARKIAELSGKSESECEEIYYAALLHDVGNLEIPQEILNKKGPLTDEEYLVVKTHVLAGNSMLANIVDYPYLSIGAQFHHERYDGKGYPFGLKGEDIPEIARIIAVADAYDAMTSKRSYRDSLPQANVREEIVKGAGTQFDPVYAKIMQHMIDLDSEYEMKAREDVRELAGNSELSCEEYRSFVSNGILLTPNMTRIRLKCTAYGQTKETPMPAMILFDSLDGRIHKLERDIKEFNYYEYGEIWFDGHTVCTQARKMQCATTPRQAEKRDDTGKKGVVYELEAVKFHDHVMIRIMDEEKCIQVITALPDSTRYAYIGLTGEHCHLYDISIAKDEKVIPADYIPRIAEEVSYIDRLEGDVPNVQVDGYRTAATAGIPISDEMKIVFHAMALPTARLIWHCPFVVIFYSDDGTVDGKNYKEYSLIRLDGEYWEAEDVSKNKLIESKNDDFEGWDVWKEINKKGFECTVSIQKKGKKITTVTENHGILIKCMTTILDEEDEIYVALSGDQCALTDIRIKR